MSLVWKSAFPNAGWGEGAVRLFDCTVGQVCDSAIPPEAAKEARGPRPSVWSLCRWVLMAEGGTSSSTKTKTERNAPRLNGFLCGIRIERGRVERFNADGIDWSTNR